MTESIDRMALAEAAHAILTSDLERRGNTLGPTHRAALLELVDTFAMYCTGEAQGRKAFALPTGLGKTSAVVAFITALDRAGLDVGVSVAASKVEALCALKRDLIEHGVSPDRIGLKHAVPGASEPSTGNEDRRYQLVTHARVRGGSDFALFGNHKGTVRALCIYDETLLRSDSFAFPELSLRMELGALGPLAEERGDPDLSAVYGYLLECSAIIKAALDKLRASGDPNRNGLPVELPARDEAILTTWANALQRHAPQRRTLADVLAQLLAVSQEPLQVLTSDQGVGVVAMRQAVPAALRNVLILDASTPIRELARMDPTISAVDSFPQRDLKDWQDVQVHQLLAAGGRSAIEQSYSQARNEASAVSREVLDIIRQQDRDESILVFSFVKRGNLDVLAQLRTDLHRAGLDPDALTSKGKRRFEFLHWGRHEGENGFEHCTTVILAGVLHRAHLDIAAAIKGQQDHLGEPTPSSLVRHVVESEVAHAVMQAASRGSCRRLHLGKAAPMKLYLIHRSAALRPILEKVMPGAQWFHPEPRHLKKASVEGRVVALQGRMLEYLRTLPDRESRVSSRTLKVALGVGDDAGSKSAFSRAAANLEGPEHGWELVGRSVVRSAIAYGFAT